MSKPKAVVPGYTLCGKIGSGTSGDVYRAKKNTAISSTTKEFVAIKCILKGRLSSSVVDSIVTEIKLLKTLKHPHIVEMKDFLWDESYIYIIMEYCAGGDLSSAIKARKRLKESTCKIFLQQLSLALQYLRANNVSHMDLKPQNLLLASRSNPTLKLTDFGLAQSLSSFETETSLRGSPLYMAPEILLQESYNASVDLWSVGVILFECLFGRAPYSSRNMAELVDKIKNAAPIVIPANKEISSDCTDLLTRLLQRNPEQRITFQQFFDHPFLKPVTGKEDEERAEQLIGQARECETELNLDQAFRLYHKALDHFVAAIEHETNAERKLALQKQLSDAMDRAEALRTLLPRPGEPKNADQPAPSAASNSTAATPFDELKTLVSTTPSLKAALEIGTEGVQYDAEGQFSVAYERYEVALQKIVQHLSLEPRGRRKALLHQQATLWMDRAEKLKDHLTKSESPCEADCELAEYSHGACSLQ